jgi:hypothetical protein
MARLGAVAFMRPPPEKNETNLAYRRNSPAATVRYAHLITRRAAAPYSLSGWSIMGAGEGQVLQLTDGSEVVVRPIGPDDASLLQA